MNPKFNPKIFKVKQKFYLKSDNQKILLCSLNVHRTITNKIIKLKPIKHHKGSKISSSYVGTGSCQL